MKDVVRNIMHIFQRIKQELKFQTKIPLFDQGKYGCDPLQAHWSSSTVFHTSLILISHPFRPQVGSRMQFLIGLSQSLNS